MAISANIFTRCSPAIGNSLSSCGSVTKCDVISATPADLTTIFTDGEGKFRDIQSLLGIQFEMKACGAKTNGLFELLMSGKKSMGPFLRKVPTKGSDSVIEPFIMAGQKSVINDEYWSVVTTTGTNPVSAHVRSRNNVALDVSWFPQRMRVFIFSKTGGGTATRTMYRVTQAELSSSGGNDTILLTLIPENSATFGDSAKVTTPTSGVLVRGTANVNDFERWCENRPALNNNQNLPFWFETDRWTMCVDDLYQEWLAELTKKNPYFARFGDVTIAERNRQYAQLFQREWVNQFFWGKPLANQTLAAYRSLEQITTSSADQLYLPNEGRCIGFRANAIGIYEQMLQCNRVRDLQGQTLNLLEFFDELYLIMRARADQGKSNAYDIDVFMDSFSAANFQRAMIRYYNAQSEGLARFMFDTKKVVSGSNDQLGFKFDTYHLIYPQGVTLHIVTNNYFDDMASAANAEGIVSTGRFMWILDFDEDIYAGIIASNRVVHRTGQLADLAKVDNAFACVMANPTQEVSLNSVTWTAVLTCPANNLIIENFADAIPDHAAKVGQYSDLYS